MGSYEKLVQKTIDLHREITQAKLTRRDLLKMGMLSATTGLLLPISGLSLRALAKDGVTTTPTGPAICPIPGVAPPLGMISPPTRPWLEEMPRLVEKQTVGGNQPSNIDAGYYGYGAAPAPMPVGDILGRGGDSKIHCLYDHPELSSYYPVQKMGHQAWTGSGPLNHPPQKWYELRQKQFNHVWHKDLPAGGSGQPAWGFDGLFPGPMFRVRYGEPHFVRIHNDLPSRNLGFGINQTSTHLHNMHTPAESDGNPLLPNYPGCYWDHHYPNVYAGVNQFGGLGDPNEALGTLWYHDHKLDFTAQNVYAGLVGMTSIYDAPGIYANPNMGDYGDPDEATGWRLPCGNNFEFDVGMVFHDRQFDTLGADFFPLSCFDGAIGDKVTVNGKIQPFFPVKRRKYRLRMLDMGPSRTYQWALSDNSNFVVIAADGNLFTAPVTVKTFQQAPAERFDVILDFSKYAVGTEIILYNRAEQISGAKPTGKLLTPGMPVLKFIVDSGGVTDNSIIPTTLRPLPNMAQPVSTSRSWTFKRSGGEWVVNGEPFDRNVISATMQEGTAEKWAIINGGGGWTHPVHIHYEEHQVITYNGKPVTGLRAGRRDVLTLEPNAFSEVYLRFRDYKGLYAMHCHNVVHEDHAMMVLWKIV